MDNVRDPIASIRRADFGILPITYHIGPGPAKVRLAVKSHYEMVPVYNVIVKIAGSTLPDEWIIRANHYDAWVNGAADPVSGAAAQLEEARALGELLKQGWRPRRTIVYAFWDGEEQGWLGSTEWAETHATELAVKAVAYLASDGTSRGFLNLAGSHALERFANDIAKDIIDPVTNTSAFDRLDLRARASSDGADARDGGGRGAAKNGEDFRLGALGSGSDFTPFIHHLGIATLSMNYSGEGGQGGVYHSIYDNPTWYLRFSDGDFAYGRMFAQTFTTAVLRLAGADVLPFRFTNLSQTLETYAPEVQQAVKKIAKAPAFDLAPIDKAVQPLQQASADGSLFRKSSAERADLNLLLRQSERRMLAENGLPRRPWFKHAFYAPGFYTGYAAKTLPGVREAIEAGNWVEAAEQQQALVGVIENLTTQIRTARRRLQ